MENVYYTTFAVFSLLYLNVIYINIENDSFDNK